MTGTSRPHGSNSRASPNLWPPADNDLPSSKLDSVTVTAVLLCVWFCCIMYVVVVVSGVVVVFGVGWGECCFK